MKDYATETDVFTTPDPLFYRGDTVAWGEWQRESSDGLALHVDTVAWNAWENSWAYTLLWSISGDQYDERWANSFVTDNALEKDLKLVSRPTHKNLSKSSIVNGKKFILQKC